eukprot:Em0003g1591a
MIAERMSTAAKQKEEIAQKAKAARELCTTMEAKVEEQNKAAVRHTKLMWCTAVMLTVLSLCLAASALLSFNTFRGLEELFGKTSNLFHQVNKLTQEQNANEHNLSTLEGRQEKSGVLTKCCRDLESKLSKLNDTLQENTEVVRTEQDKVKSLDSLLTDKLSAASLEQKETFDVVKVEQERMNIMVTHLSDNIRHLEGKLEKLSSTALSQQEAHVHPEYADQFQQLFDEGARLVERMKQLEVIESRIRAIYYNIWTVLSTRVKGRGGYRL